MLKGHNRLAGDKWPKHLNLASRENSQRSIRDDGVNFVLWLRRRGGFPQVERSELDPIDDIADLGVQPAAVAPAIGLSSSHDLDLALRTGRVEVVQ